jgi:hypothetical protein
MDLIGGKDLILAYRSACCDGCRDSITLPARQSLWLKWSGPGPAAHSEDALHAASWTAHSNLSTNRLP